MTIGLLVDKRTADMMGIGPANTAEGGVRVVIHVRTSSSGILLYSPKITQEIIIWSSATADRPSLLKPSVSILYYVFQTYGPIIPTAMT